MRLAAWLNTAWMWKCAGEARAFRRAAGRPAECQAEVLAAILQRNRDTEFGRAHGFSRIVPKLQFGNETRAYQERVPLSSYEDYQESIARIAHGHNGILTADRVELLEPTSGTIRGEKLIPYTATLRRQFQRAVAVWVYDLFRHRPALRNGRAYWSISPALGPPRRTTAGIPIGFDDDAAYLGTLERLLLDRLLVSPPAAARQLDLETFRYATLLRLLQAEDLVLVSVWNPTFLTTLLALLPSWQERLCFDLRRGSFSPPAPVSPELARRLALPGRFERRAGELHALFRSRTSFAEKLHRVWPRLALISCWADAAAAHRLPELYALFPAVEIQPKGLLATEGCVSFPLLGRAAPVLAVRSHFFEFQESECGGTFANVPHSSRCRLAHELETGGHYRVVLTTGGGLYRYQLRDEVEVVGLEGACPLLRFLGKADRTSDLVGEKLAEPHVRDVLERLFAEHGLSPRFALLVPITEPPLHYRLYLQGIDPRDCTVLTVKLETGLQENPHYRYAVDLGQLAPVEIELLPGHATAAAIYEQRCLAGGQRLGTIKPAVLDAWSGWPKEFAVLQKDSLEIPNPKSQDQLFGI